MSIYNEEYDHTFIHNPKTGGTSMERMPFVGGSAHATIKELGRRGVCWGFVRHPADRALSAWIGLHQRNPKAANLAPTFKEYIMGLPGTKCSNMAAHSRPQCHYLCIDGKIALDFVGRFERILKDWKKVCTIIKVEFQELHHLNKSEHDSWETYYSDKMIRKLKEVFAEDFETFGYE